MQKSCQETLDTGNFTMVKLAPAVLQKCNTLEPIPLQLFCQCGKALPFQIVERAGRWPGTVSEK